MRRFITWNVAMVLFPREDIDEELLPEIDDSQGPSHRKKRVIKS